MKIHVHTTMKFCVKTHLVISQRIPLSIIINNFKSTKATKKMSNSGFKMFFYFLFQHLIIYWNGEWYQGNFCYYSLFSINISTLFKLCKLRKKIWNTRGKLFYNKGQNFNKVLYLCETKCKYYLNHKALLHRRHLWKTRKNFD